jgi:hypothetical protein
MNDDHPYLEKRLGHKPYGRVRSWGKIAIWLVLIAIACGFRLQVGSIIMLYPLGFQIPQCLPSLPKALTRT